MNEKISNKSLSTTVFVDNKIKLMINNKNKIKDKSYVR